MIKNIMIVSLIVGLMAAKTFATDIQFLTHSSAEQTYIEEQGELRGQAQAGKRAFHVELVRAMIMRMNHPNNIMNYPLVRAIRMVQEEDNVALFNLSRTPERADD